MTKYKADFFLWDDDLDLDEILGDYTADESENDNCSKAIDSNAYQCPECKKEYKSISGFRGHVLKKHEKNLRAADYKKGPENIQQATRTEQYPEEIEQFHTVYPSAYQKSLKNLQHDLMYNIFGNSKLPIIAQSCENNEPFSQYFESVIEKCLNGNRISTSEERELFFKTLHQTRINKEIIEKGITLLQSSTDITDLTTMDINNFIQDFILDLF